MNKKIFIALIISSLTLNLLAQESMPLILPLRKRAEVIDKWLEMRMQTVLPTLMRREKIDMWILISREYNEDPVLKTMLPAEWLSARRRTILVIYDNPQTKQIETLAIARYNVGNTFKSAWQPEKQPDQWKRLVEVVEERNPQKIAVNISPLYGHADGLDWTDFETLRTKMPTKWVSKIISGERLAVAWLETRTPEEMAVYTQIGRIAHQIIREGLSEKVIQPGVTTTQDVQWWYRERIAELKLEAWFHPTVSLQRADNERFDHLRSFSSKPGDEIIQPGDLVHVDFGITYLRLNTDTQQHAYILKPNEKDAPEGLKTAFKVGNRLQDILTAQFKEGRTGNEILKGAIQQAQQEGIEPVIYSHPIGYHGHGAGPTIGLWDQQGGVTGTGDYPLYYQTAYSIELNCAVNIPEWNNKKIRIMLEEDGYFDQTGFRYISGRQTELLLIPRPLGQIGN
ncbi:MAG: M24 family metallopeptidase [Microscillaceae bacterium]|jgi:Xaa-Pro aminopeptidase|nr:M24 family metallopeptidase [Microscillaceae bacterium]